MVTTEDLIRQNRRYARSRWGNALGRIALGALKNFTEQFRFSLVNGDLLFLDTGWYVTNAGLTSLARRNRCAGIRVQPVQPFCDPSTQRWAFEATVYKSKTCKGFAGYGDADPSNVSPLVHGAEMRVAETRAVNRALRKAYGIGICSVEEIGSSLVQSSRDENRRKFSIDSCERNKQWHSTSSRSTLPDHPPASARSRPGQGLCDRLLRHQDPARSHPRAGRKLRRASCRLGRERPQCPALPTQQLSRQQRRCRMKRRFAGLHAADLCERRCPDGMFLVRVERARVSLACSEALLHPATLSSSSRTSSLDSDSPAASIAPPKALWKLDWFLRDFGYDTELLGRDEIDEKALSDFAAWSRSVTPSSTALPCSISTALRQPANGKNSRPPRLLSPDHRGGLMTYSYTQISQYLTCPRRYRHRYLDGWKEKDTRAAMLFGRAFEQALGAFFRREDPGSRPVRGMGSLPETSRCSIRTATRWDRMLRARHSAAGPLLPGRPHPRSASPVAICRSSSRDHLATSNDFVAYVDAIGQLDGKRCLLEWKTTSSRYPEEPDGLLALDPQLVCYSWITGISEVAQVVFVRKRLVEIQYLRPRSRTNSARSSASLVEDTIRQIESAQFLPHSGIRFPQNPCSSCPYVGLCLGKQELVEAALVRRPGARLLVGLTSLLTRYPPMPPKLNRRRALFVLTKIDEILAWEQRKESGAGHALRRAGAVSVRSAGGTVLAAGESEIL